jgi:hypothetical protein
MALLLRNNRVHIGNLAVMSVQHYPLPESGHIGGPQSSCGAVPVYALDAARIVVPVHATDALWFGLTSLAGEALAVSASLKTARHGWLDVFSGRRRDPRACAWTSVLPASALDGIPREGGGLWPFARCPADSSAPAARRLDLCLRPQLREPGGHYPNDWPEFRIALALVSPHAYLRLTGSDPGRPADPGDRFGGYLLP